MGVSGLKSLLGYRVDWFSGTVFFRGHFGLSIKYSKWIKSKFVGACKKPKCFVAPLKSSILVSDQRNIIRKFPFSPLFSYIALKNEVISF